MGNNYIDALIDAVARVVRPNASLLKEVLVIGGMPEKTQNIKYLSYNRDTIVNSARICEFSAVAVINNRRADCWQLSGTAQKVSQWVFSSRWARNPLDLFLNNLRCDPAVMRVLADAESRYTLLGILTVTELTGTKAGKPSAQYIRPVVGVPGIEGGRLATVQAFEADNRIKKAGLIGLHLYRKASNQMAGS